MRMTSKPAAHVLSSGVFLTVALAASAFVTFLNTDRLVERSLSAALVTDGLNLPLAQRRAQIPVSGTEDFWLKQPGPATQLEAPLELVAGAAPIGLGQTVILTIAGHERSFEVAEVVAVPSNVTHLEVGPGTRLVLISLRDKEKPSAPLLRLVTEAVSGSLSGYDPANQHAL